MEENIDELLQSLSKALEPFVKAVRDFVKAIDRAFYNAYGSKLPCKPVRNYPEYKYIKPNIKPYRVFKRLYRVQRR